ncbi:MAG: biopolymer transporter ExbD [Thiogranum sp.]|nr:biopolymer transporter ExbD [Thiogranum sp.]
MKRRWRKNHLGDPAEVNITAFMNLMVILVPFLLITAVFSRITILDLNLPVPGSSSPSSKQDDQDFHLEIIVRRHSVEIGDLKNGLLRRIDVTDDASYLVEISELLQQIKARYPDKQDVTLLLEKDISYERLVAMMDTLRVVRVDKEGASVMAELFPNISIGDAPTAELRTAERSD